MSRKIIFPGTFDPITNGHLALIMRARELFDEVLIAVAKDVPKQTIFTFEKRIALVEAVIQPFTGITVKGFSGLTAHFCLAESACAILRGVRSSKDFEYEFEMAQINQTLVQTIQTVMLVPESHYLYLSASMVREISRLGGDVSAFVPPLVLRALQDLTRQ